MLSNSDFLLNFHSIDKTDAHLVGEEGVILGDLANNGINIPDGFVIPTSVYFNILKSDKLRLNISQLLSNIDYSRPDSLLSASIKIEKYFLKLNLQEEFIKTIFKAYKDMGGLLRDPRVRVVSSFDNHVFYEKLAYGKPVETDGEANLILKIKKAWASAFRPEIIYQNHEKKINHFKLGVAVIVQKVIDYDITGFLYTRDPITDDPSKLLITFGEKALGSSVIENSNITYFEISKHDLLITKRFIKKQKSQHEKNILSDRKIIELAKLGKAIERYFYFSKRCKWGIKKGQIYITETKQLDINPYIENKTISPSTKSKSTEKTATKIYEHLTNINNHDNNQLVTSDGVGLVQGNSFIEALRVHPKAVLNDRYLDEYISKITEDLEKILKLYHPRPVVYCLSDLTSNELRNLSNGKLYEPLEINPLLGFHGLFRHIHDRKALEIEIKVIKQLRDKKGYKNLWLMIPFARTSKELIEIKKILSTHGLHRSSSFKIWLMIANIANVVSLEKFVDCGIDGISINTDCLTTLTLAVDKNNSEMLRAYDELNESVMTVIETVIKSSNKLNVPSSIYGHILNLHPHLAEKFVKWGITSITVIPEIVELVRKNIAKTEQMMIQKKYYA